MVSAPFQEQRSRSSSDREVNSGALLYRCYFSIDGVFAYCQGWEVHRQTRCHHHRHHYHRLIIVVIYIRHISGYRLFCNSNSRDVIRNFCICAASGLLC
ncbi:unnamed protein product [Amoebophrya sp. A25]|nr:unnamed protein product [Amoebophrya sp. A25]CAD7977216.1 unnamed protein product [Amoebophrya sp. A25]|eukprot:GSA25T00024301001.1